MTNRTPSAPAAGWPRICIDQIERLSSAGSILDDNSIEQRNRNRFSIREFTAVAGEGGGQCQNNWGGENGC